MVNDIIKSAIKLHFWNRLVKAEQFYSFVSIKKIYKKRNASPEVLKTSFATNL
jgi:hypothetical protein